MANQKQQSAAQKRMQKRINNMAAGVQTNMDTLYKQTYFSTPSMSKDLNVLANDINSGIDKITKTNMDTAGVPNTSKLYNRILDNNKITGNTGNVIGSIVDAFQDSTVMDNLYDSFMQNYMLKDMDDEIDAVCRYMPKLLEALETRKDNVLSADHFSKDYLTIRSDSITEDREFDADTKRLKNVYDLLQFFEDVYDDTAKYGEQFVYHVPYKTAIQRLLARKPATQTSNFREDCIAQGIDYDVISESAIGKSKPDIHLSYNVSQSGISCFNEASLSKEFKPFTEAVSSKDGASVKSDDQMKFSIEICSSNIIESAIKERFDINKNMMKVSESSIWTESAMDAKQREELLAQTNATGALSFDGMKTPKGEKYTGYDGLSGYTQDPEKIKIDIPGCVLKVLDHTTVNPIYMDDTNMGYYYLEFFAKDDNTNSLGFTNTFSDPLTSSAPDKTSGLENQMTTDRQDMLARHVSGQLAQYIDAKFVNTNQDLRTEIYTILKHNDLFNSPNLDRMKVTYIPPDEMTHVYFRKNKRTHRGISDLDRAMVPAKIFCALYITTGFGNLSRGQDKRVYYVKQQVENNIAKTLLNVVQQIKMGNFGMRQFRNINSVLNITGRFNDYIIPTNASGESPIQFEVMPGQQFELKTDLMDMLEEMAINSTDVPLELIQARMSMDYATHYTMSSIKFLRKVYKRQSQYNDYITSIITKLYNCEYAKSDNLTVTLPPPVFLNITNTSQIIQNADDYTSKMVENDLGQDEDPKLKDMYKKSLMEDYLGTYIDINRNKILLEKAKLQLKAESTQEDDQR